MEPRLPLPVRPCDRLTIQLSRLRRGSRTLERGLGRCSSVARVRWTLGDGELCTGYCVPVVLDRGQARHRLAVDEDRRRCSSASDLEEQLASLLGQLLDEGSLLPGRETGIEGPDVERCLRSCGRELTSEFAEMFVRESAVILAVLPQEQQIVIVPETPLVGGAL